MHPLSLAALAFIKKWCAFVGSNNLVHPGVEDSLGKDLLWYLGSHISVTKLGGNEDTSDITLLSIDLVYFHLDTSLGNLENLVVLLEEFFISLLSRLKTGKSNGHIVTGGSTTSLGVKEKTGTVRRNIEVSSHLETRLEGTSVSGGLKILYGEKKRNTLTSWKLNGGGGVIDTLLLGENNLSSFGGDGSLNSIKSVGLTGHDLRVDEFLFGLSSLSDFLLYGPGLWLNAHINKLGSSFGGDGVLSDDLRAPVGKTSSLYLKVRKLVKLLLGDGLCGGSGDTNGNSTGGDGGSNLGNIVLQCVKLGGASTLVGGGEGGGGGHESKGAGSCELHRDVFIEGEETKL
mmetsp:Transcript_17010/g.23353  ORF Transcript_17010/g.23353 Transcript_17010/m.23353 type:complete len:344 (-) Transcript_17010:46-1077(-)